MNDKLDFDSFSDRRAEVTGALRQLGEFASKLGASSLASRIFADLVEKVARDRFHLVALGEFNHGKSSFVNALLGRPLLPVGVTPTTAVIHHIEYADEPCASVVFASGDRRQASLDELRTLTVTSDRPSEAIAHVEIGLPAEVLRGIVLVDTPGVNDLSLSRADITYGYIPRADAVLFLLDAGQVLKESERVFLQSKLVGQARDKIVFVINKADLLSEDEREEALAYVRENLAKILPSPKVFLVSSERALASRREESGLPELVDSLNTFLAEERGRILLENALGDGLRAAEVLRKGVDAKRRGLTMSADELSRRISFIEKDLEGTARTLEERRAAIREEASAIKAWARRDFEHFRDDLVRRLPGIIDEQKGDEVKAHLGAFLEATFRDFASKETGEIADALEALAEKTIALVREDARAAAQKLVSVLGEDVRKPSIEVNTFAYDVGISALFTVGVFVMFGNLLLGGLLAIAAPVLAVYVRDRVGAEVKKRAKELAPEAVTEAVAKILPKLAAMIDDFAAQLDAWVVTAGEELHRELLEVLTAARRSREVSQMSSAEALEACDREGEALASLRDRFEALRTALPTLRRA